MTPDLTAYEQAALDRCEAVIRDGLQTFLQVGSALARIRDHRLYRATHATFPEYLAERWGISRAHGNRLIRAYEVVQVLAPIGADAPATESQARELAPLLEHPERLRAAWSQVIASECRPTATAVRQVVRAVQGHTEPTTPEPPAAHDRIPSPGAAGEGAPSGSPHGSGPEGDAPTATTGPDPQPDTPPAEGPESGGPDTPHSRAGAGSAAAGASPSTERDEVEGEATSDDEPVLTDAEIHQSLADRLSPYYLDELGCRQALVSIALGAPVDRAVARSCKRAHMSGHLLARVRAGVWS